jgi:phosphate transport system substrate-binding protein
MRPIARAAAALACAALAGALGAADAAGAPAVDTALPAYQPRPVQVPRDAGYVLADGSVRIVGAEHAAAMIEKFDALFQRTHPGVRFTPVLRGTSTAMPAMTYGVSLFAPSGRDASPVELVPYRKMVGAEPVSLRVAHSSHVSDKASQSLAVFVHRSNPLQQVTLEQLQRIFTAGNAKGDFSDWGQLGLSGEWSHRAIHTYGTPEYTGFGNYLQKTYFHGAPVKASQQMAGNSKAITRAVAADASAVGIASLAFAGPDLKALPIVDAHGNAISATPEHAVAGDYPLGRYLYFFLRKDKGQALDPLAAEYMRLVLSREGQEIVASDPEGYLPLTAAQAAAELEKLQ